MDNNETQVDIELQQLLDDIEVEPDEILNKPEESEKRKDSAPAFEVEVEVGDNLDPIAIDRPTGNAEFDRLLEKFSATKEEIERSFSDDRIKIQELLEMIIGDDGGELKNAQLEAIASLMSTKATIPANRIRLLDSYSKFLVATKNYSTGKSNDVEVGDLKGILSSYDDDEP